MEQPEGVRDAGARLPRLPGVRARVLHDVRVRAGDRSVRSAAARRRAARRPNDRVVICRDGGLNSRDGRDARTRDQAAIRRRREAARAAVLAAGGTPVRGRRLQEDCLLDTADEMLRRRRSVLRVRMESGRSLLTFKGPVQPSAMKLREELETVVGDGTLMLRVLEELGFHVWFRYQKYREEFALDDVIDRGRRDAGRHVRRNRGRRARHRRRRPKRSAAARPTTCSTRIAARSSATARSAACPSPTCCSTTNESCTALVLAAGLGTRLRPLTDVCAKPAIPVAGEPIIRRIVRWLAAHDVNDLVVNLHHLPQTRHRGARRRQRPVGRASAIRGSSRGFSAARAVRVTRSISSATTRSSSSTATRSPT